MDDDVLEKRFFAAGEELSAMSSQFEGVEVEGRRRRVTIIAVTAIILVAMVFLVALALPAPPSDLPAAALPVIESR